MTKLYKYEYIFNGECELDKVHPTFFFKLISTVH